jgi:hypothetical protein
LTSSNLIHKSLPGSQHRAIAKWQALLRCICVGLLCALATVARAQIPALSDASSIRMPADFRQIEFYLITVDVGNNVWDNFGHTALRMVDESTGTDLVFNWGLFDTSIGYSRFAARFARGIMQYQLGVSPPGWEFSRYQQEQRTVWQDRLLLTNPQKMRLYQRLAWNIRPENIIYDYDYFFDNCTTRVRDYIDEALGGVLSQRSSGVSPLTFRDEVNAHYASQPLIHFSLDVLMNERIDRRMTEWEQMFLPLQLREQMSRANLLADPQVLMQFEPPKSGPNPYQLAGLLIIPALLLVFALKKASIASFNSQPGLTLRMPAVTFRLLGVLGLIIAGFSGIYGLIMSFAWLFSSHADLHGNINLLLFWPTDIVGVFFALHWLITGRAYELSAGKNSLVMFYLVLHLLALVVYLIIGVAGFADQSTGSLMIYVLPLLLIMTLLVSVAGVRQRRAIRFF